jgi:hypothetical protein
MSLITVEQFKEHARIDGDDEDDAILVKVDAANKYVLGFLEDPLPEDWTAPDDLIQATLMIAAHWWEHRETAFVGQIFDIPLNAQDVIANYREWSF